MDDDGCGDVVSMAADLVEEVHRWLGGGWHSVVGPGCEPEVGDVTRHEPLRKGEEKEEDEERGKDIKSTMHNSKSGGWTDRQTDKR